MGVSTEVEDFGVPIFFPFSNLATIFVAKSQTELKELPVTCKAWPSLSPSVTRFLKVFQAPVTQTKICLHLSSVVSLWRPFSFNLH